MIARAVKANVPVSDPSKATIPATYVRLILELASERGLDSAVLLKSANIDEAILLRPDTRVPALAVSQLFYRVLQHSKDNALGYEVGLRSNLTSHGYIGFGLLSFPLYRDVLEFGVKFFTLRTPFFDLKLVEDGESAALEIGNKVNLGVLRQPLVEMLLSGLWKMAPQISGNLYQRDEEACIWFDFEEPEYFKNYKDRLPKTHFNMPANQLRFPARILSLKIDTADKTTSQMVTDQCEREMSVLGLANQDWGTRVRQVLERGAADYPKLDEVAALLHISTRSLKRKLAQQQTSFLELLNDTRVQEAKKLLADSDMKIVDIAGRLGYNNAGNFTRAFTKWADQTPSVYRKQFKQ